MVSASHTQRYSFAQMDSTETQAPGPNLLATNASFFFSDDSSGKRKTTEHIATLAKRRRDSISSEQSAGHVVPLISSSTSSVRVTGSPQEPHNDDPVSGRSYNDAAGFVEFDQKEEDELSRINWSYGRRRGPAGLLTCLYDRRRERGDNPELKPKKKVRFVTDEKLVKIQTFEMDEDERENVFKMKLLAQQQGLDIAQMEMQRERQSLEVAAQHEMSNHQEAYDESPWYDPPTIARLPPPLTERGIKSVEKVVFFARQSGSLSALFLNRENLPDSPDEPVEAPRSSLAEPKVIPVVRAGLVLSQLTPMVAIGPVPPEEVSTPVAATPAPLPMTPPATQPPPMFMQNPPGSGGFALKPGTYPEGEPQGGQFRNPPASDVQKNDLIHRLLGNTFPKREPPAQVNNLDQRGFASQVLPGTQQRFMAPPPQQHLETPRGAPLRHYAPTQEMRHMHDARQDQRAPQNLINSRPPFPPESFRELRPQNHYGLNPAIIHDARPRQPTQSTCRFFLGPNGCRHGLSCRFAHNK